MESIIFLFALIASLVVYIVYIVYSLGSEYLRIFKLSVPLIIIFILCVISISICVSKDFKKALTIECLEDPVCEAHALIDMGLKDIGPEYEYEYEDVPINSGDLYILKDKLDI